MREEELDIKKLDPTIHERMRLAILILLADSGSMDYNSLKKVLKTSDGNLVTHLRKLEDKGLIAVKKFFEGRRPKTIYSITEEGREKLSEYLKAIKQLIGRIDSA